MRSRFDYILWNFNMPDNETYPHAQAFPSDREDGFLGLTKREYFAAIALQGLLANPGLEAELAEASNVFSYFSKLAVTYSDHLIKELNK